MKKLVNTSRKQKAGSGLLFILFFILTGQFSLQAQSSLIAGWDFQTTTNGGTAAAAAPNTPVVFVANFGSGTLYLNGTNGSSTWTTATTGNQLTSFGGSTVNAGAGFSTTTSGAASLAVVNSTANGKSMTFVFSMANKANLVVTYASQRTTTGFNNQLWEYSTDGTTWFTAQSVGSIPTTYGLLTLNPIVGLDNAATAYLRLTVTGASATAGNNRLDNIQLNASLASPPVVANDTAYGTVGVPFSKTISATGNPTSYALSGEPSWMSYNSTTGLMTGTPDAVGTTLITIDAFNGAGSGTGSTTVIIGQGSQSIIFPALNPVTYGDAPFNLNATGGGSGNPVTYISSNTGVANISGNTVTITGAGTATITASQAGNANYTAATDVNQTLTVNQASQNITFGPLSPVLSTDPPFALNATGGGSGNPVEFSSSNTSVATILGNILTIQGPGTTTITATQNGNTNYLAATPVAQNLVVNFAGLLPQTITFNSLASVTYGDAPLVLGATGGGSGNPVVYTSSDTSIVSIQADTAFFHKPGTVSISANQAGNSTYAVANTVSQSLTVLPKEISFPGALALSKSYDGNNTAQLTGINLTGIVGSDVVTVSGGGTFASTGAGTGIAVTANLSLGGADAFKYILVQPTGLTADIYQASQAITFNALPNKTYGNAPFQLTATGGGSTSPVTYTSDNPLVATVLGDMVTITGVGIANITASQNGDVNYMAAPDVIQPLTVVKANQSISFAALPGKSLGDPPFALTATATSGLPVSYTSSNNAVASISGNMVTINGIGTCTITASQAGNANYNAAFDVNRTLSVTYPLIAAWDFFGQNSPATFAATTFHSNLNNTGGLTNITRGATAPSSTGSNSFRTTGFKNEGIAVSNTDYFQTTLKAQPGYKISLSSINASMAGTSTYAASPGVSSQFAYSLDGVNFTLIGNPFVTIGSPANSPLIDVTSIPALQNIHSSLTLTIRYYASGQTTTGGWGFNSASAGVNGLAYGGTVVPCTPVSNTSSVTVCANTLPYVWNGQSLTTSGTYSHTAISSGGCDSTEILNLTVNPCSNTVLSVKAFIQAYYLGGGQMSPALANQGISNPPVNACDSIVVELRDTLAPFNVYHSATVILNQDGTLTDTLPNTNGYYYIVLRHRNALQTWSAQPVLISGNTVNYDFTTSAAQAYGSNQIEIATGPSLWALYSGDVVIDENMDLLDLGAIETDISNFGSGYLSTDLNGDGNVDLLDSPVLESNISNFIYSIHP